MGKFPNAWKWQNTPFNNSWMGQKSLKGNFKKHAIEWKWNLKISADKDIYSTTHKYEKRGKLQ